MRYILALLAFFGAVPGLAQAQMPDCMTPGYLDSFRFRGATDLTCSEVFNFTIATPAGERHIRGISDLNADWAFQPGTIAAAESAARQASAALNDLGEYLIGDVTILLLSDSYLPVGETPDEPPPPADDDERSVERDAIAQAWDPVAGGNGECRMTLFLWGEGGITAEFPTTVAHELFHCVQFASLTPEQMATYEGGGAWWVEGSAEAFAAHAIPDSTHTAQVALDFNGSVDAQVPLYEMEMEATVFFYWLIHDRSIAGLMPFLAQMSETPGAAGQREAMRAAMGDEEWLRFAEDYSDEAIPHPHGQPLVLGPTYRAPILDVSESAVHTISLPPFVLISGQADYACGRWDNVVSPAAANLSTRLDSDSDWTRPWQATVDTRDGADPMLRIAAIHTGDADLDYRLDVRRVASCNPCMGSTEIDRCLVGEWQGDTSPIIDLMARAGAPVSRNAMGSVFMTLFEDGTYLTSTSRVDFQVTETDRHGVTTYDTTGTAGASRGQWSILGPGQMAGCSASTDRGDVVVDYQTPESSGQANMSFGAFGAESGSVTYTCGPTQMSTTVSMGRFGDLTFPFTRLSPPPEAPAE